MASTFLDSMMGPVGAAECSNDFWGASGCLACIDDGGVAVVPSAVNGIGEVFFWKGLKADAAAAVLVIDEVYSLFGMADTDTDAVVFFCIGWPVTTVVVEEVNEEMVVVVWVLF